MVINLLIVNADDFGNRQEINSAILECFQQGVISSTTIMANEPEFEAACELAQCNGFVDRIGIHVNITLGIPLTDEIRAMRTFCNSNGEFAYRHKPYLVFTKREQNALANEVRAQIERCRQHGIPLTHADSHHGVHNEMPVFSAIWRVLKESGIYCLRGNQVVDDDRLLRKLYKLRMAACFRQRGFWTPDYTSTLMQFISEFYPGKQSNVSCELSVHPDYIDGKLIDHVTGQPLVPALRHLLAGMQIEPFSRNNPSAA